MNIDQHILRALRQEPDAGPPADFARRVAAAAGSAPRPVASVEQWLLRGLVAVFVLSALVVGAMHGRDWLAGLPALPGAGMSTWNWAAALLACIALSWSLDRLRAERGAGAGAAPIGRR